MKKKIKIPSFKSEDAEREFWSKINLADYFEPLDAANVSFPNLKPTTRAISIRLPDYLIDRLKEEANAINIPYQSLIKGYLKMVLFEKSTGSRR
jgi:predicted DNA binding CopG/RHH family protein